MWELPSWMSARESEKRHWLEGTIRVRLSVAFFFLTKVNCVLRVDLHGVCACVSRWHQGWHKGTSGSAVQDQCQCVWWGCTGDRRRLPFKDTFDWGKNTLLTTSHIDQCRDQTQESVSVLRILCRNAFGFWILLPEPHCDWTLGLCSETVSEWALFLHVTVESGSWVLTAC